ncbi:MAG: CvpA family protein [Hyphomicrobiales bacterium]|nr:CvpA family protein [Hyphomicrobiales bacterium]
MIASVVDIAILIVMGIFAVLGVQRGFTRKVVSMLAWTSAILAALWGFQPLGDWLSDYLAPLWFAHTAAAFAIFISVLTAVLSLGYGFSIGLISSSAGILDRGLGLLFGLAQGLILMSLLYLGIIWWSDNDERPEWLGQARLLPVVESVSLLLWKGAIEISSVEEIWPNLRFDPSVLPDLAPEIADDPAEKILEGSGYDESGRKEMDKFINSLGGEN